MKIRYTKNLSVLGARKVDVMGEYAVHRIKYWNAIELINLASHQKL